MNIRCVNRRPATALIEILSSVEGPHRCASWTRVMAGCFGFFIFTQCGERPPRYGRSLCLETNPSRPSRHAWRKRSGPISPSSKSDRKMPSTRRANSRDMFVLRMLNGSFRTSSDRQPRCRKHRIALRHTALAAMKAIKVRSAVYAEQHDLTVDHKKAAPIAERILNDQRITIGPVVAVTRTSERACRRDGRSVCCHRV